MIEFKISGKEYKIEDVTIQQYYDIQDLIVRQDFSAKVEIISKISECPTSELKKLEKHQFVVLWDNVVNHYLDISEQTPFHRNLVFNGQLFGFIDVNKITLGEFADMDVLKTDPMSQKKLHMMMAILYRPAVQITEKWMEVEAYDSDTMMQRAEEFLHLPIKYVTGALNFFSAVSKYYVETTLNSLTQNPSTTQREKLMIELSSQIMLELLETGVKSYTSVQETISPKLEKLNELAQLEYSTTLRTENKNKEKKRTIVDKWNFKAVTNKLKRNP
jgi:hypothetical protein